MVMPAPSVNFRMIGSSEYVASAGASSISVHTIFPGAGLTEWPPCGDERANRLGIGPQGYGGDTTAFGIHILTYPCHITSLPVAVTIECHAHRHKEATL
jgi:tartrate dehydratase alpha subunit/fumarate hydratase class I-like protein